MSKIYQSVTQLIGATPLLELTRLEEKYALPARLLVKLESANPGGSAKDRVALRLLQRAREECKLTPDSVIIEPTSGNTGIGLSAVAAAWGLKCLIVMPETMSRERKLLMKAYGAQLVLTPGEQGMAGAIAKARELAEKTPGSFLAGQFENPANPQAHYLTTGPEIWADTDGQVDVFVAGIGTGGTLSGTGRYLKERKPSLRILGIEPADSPVITQGWAGAHGLQGIGAGFVPRNLDLELVDQVRTVTQDEALERARELGRLEGVLCGISGGAALAIALEEAKENRGKTVVCLLPDSGERYLSTELYDL